MEIFSNIFIDIAQAAPEKYVLTPDKITIFYEGIMHWIAGIFILIAAIYLPFQIGGIGQSIINGFGKIYKTGMEAPGKGIDAFHKGVSTAKNLSDLYGGPALWELMKRRAGKAIFGSMADEKDARAMGYEKDLAKEKRHGQEDIYLRNAYNAISKGDPKGANDWFLRFAQAADRDALNRDAENEKIETMEKKIEESIINNPEFDNFKDGKAVSGKYLEDSLNIMGVIKRWASDPTRYQDKYQEAQAIMDKFANLYGLGYDKFNNFRHIGSPGNASPNPHLLESILKDSKLGKQPEDKIPGIRLDKNEANSVIGTPDVDAKIANMFTKYNADPKNASNKIETLSQLAQHYHNSMQEQINNQSSIFITGLKNTGIDKIEEVNKMLQNNNYKEALEYAKINGMKNLQIKIESMPKDFLGNIKQNTLDGFILQNSVKNYLEARKEINNKIDNEIKSNNYGNINLRNLESSVANQPYESAAKIMINNINQLDVDLDKNYHEIHDKLKNTIIQNNDTIDQRIEKIINYEKLDQDYAKEIFGSEITNKILEARKNSTFVPALASQSGKDEYKIKPEDLQSILSKLQKIDNNYENISKKLIIYNK